MKYAALWASVLALILFVALFFIFAKDLYACESTPITPNTPTGIAGCYREGDGIASHYGPGNGVAMNYCTWALRDNSGCGSVTITSLDTGRSVTVPVIDFCDCYTGTANERLVDLQYDVVTALGLDLSAGLYRVNVRIPESFLLLPNTAMLGG
jgi:hypothetical protein